MHRIVVEIENRPEIELDVWIFAEDVARNCSIDGHARLDLARVRRPADRLVVEVHSSSHVRRLVKAIEALAEKHHLSDRTLVFDEKYTP